MYNNDQFNELFHNPQIPTIIDAKFISIFNEEYVIDGTLNEMINSLDISEAKLNIPIISKIV